MREGLELVSYFVSKYKELYGSAPIVNRSRAKWEFSDMLIDMKHDEVQRLIDYFLTTPGEHSLKRFFANYDKLAESMEISHTQENLLVRQREDTEERARAWRDKWQGRNAK